MKTLDEIGCAVGTDRASNGIHNYLGTYEEFMNPMRRLPIVLLEMGVFQGAGLRMWSEYFTSPDARIVGIDTGRDFPFGQIGMPADGRVTAKQGSQSDGAFLGTLPARFDVVIDDAGHTAAEQMIAFELLWPRVKPWGLYFLEDLHTAWSSDHCNGPCTIMGWLWMLLADMQDHRGAQGMAKRDAGDKWDSIDTVTVRKGMAVFRKQRR